jgi:hypothetical protein
MAGYSLRPSQFVFTFGVGSIIETSSGPRIIPDFDNWGQIFYRGKELNVSDFQIDVHLHPDILDGNIFSIPTNVMLNKKESEGIYKTFAFPDWGLCVEHGYLYEFDGDHTRCPGCKKSRTFNIKRKQGIRFVRACPDGHLDDIDWRGMIDHTSSCTSKVYHWDDRGGSLDDLRIICLCKRETTLQDVYQKNKWCTGRFPETTGGNASCKEHSQVTLRGSSMLRIPKLLPIIAIPGPQSKHHRILSKNILTTILISDDEWTKAKLVKRISIANKNSPGTISDDDLNIIENAEDGILVAAISDVMNNRANEPSTLQERRLYEFRSLKNAARNGHPLDPNKDPHFSVPKRGIRSDDNIKDAIKLETKKLRVSPIDKLRVITVQKGYQRLGTENPDNNGIRHPLVEKFYVHGNERWYPGIEQIGEGIFIDDHDEALNIVSKEWNERFLAMDERIEYHPVFVWWHSLAHRLISAISLHSGYSSASIREVVYTEVEPSGNVKGGILLYTSQPGGDGSLGGMVSKVPKFERVVEQALADLEFCSNDPLCYEQNVTDVGDSGSACYACLHMSETSCSYFNRFLDRRILLENL